MVKKVAMTIVYQNNHVFFSRVFLFKVSKITNKRNEKVLLITDLRNVNNVQLTNNLTAQSYQININTKNC